MRHQWRPYHVPSPPKWGGEGPWHNGHCENVGTETSMDLSLSEQYRDLQAEIRAFIAMHGHKSPKVGGGRKRPDQKTLDWQKTLLEHGYVGRTIPVEYGGAGKLPDVMEAAVIASEFSRANIYAGLTNQGVSMLVPTLLELGT